MALDIPNDWTFESEEVAANFDAHVREQLPWYVGLSGMLSIVAKHYLPEGARAYDVGASTGNFGALLADTIKARRVEWIGIDSSEAMRSRYRAPGQLVVADALAYPFLPFNLMVCFLSLMFFPVEERRSWLERMYSTMLNVGGAIIVVDREQPGEGILSTALARAVMKLKLSAGATADDVLKKEMSLCGIQRPLGKGFFDRLPAREVFRFGNFVAWVIEKEE